MTSLPEVLDTVVLGPEDRLVVVLPEGALDVDEDRDRMDALVELCGLGGRVLFVAGVEKLAVLRAPTAAGSTVGPCGDVMPSFTINGQPIGSCQSCHLAHGHTGLHSDGSATWFSPPAKIVGSMEAS